MLADVDLAEALQEAEQRQVQALPAAFPAPALHGRAVQDLQQPEGSGRQVAVYGFLRPGRVSCLGCSLGLQAGI